MLRHQLTATLHQLAEPDYREFAARLIPGETRLLGVRLPILRRLARRYAVNQWRELLDESAPAEASFEELLLRAMLPAYAADTTPSERLHYLAQEQPNLNNWSLCDSACATCHFIRNYREMTSHWLVPFLQSREEYTARFGVVMLNNYYAAEKEWAPWVISILPGIPANGYYADTAIAWCACTLLCRHPQHADTMLSGNYLPERIQRLLLKKLRESRIRHPELTQRLNSLRNKV